jgi:hypothetical protein
VPRKRPHQEEGGDGIITAPRIYHKRGRPSGAEADDPRLPMPVGHADEIQVEQTAGSKDARQLYTKYARNLVQTKGNVPEAIRLTMDLDHEPTNEEIVEYHEKLRGASKSFQTVSEIIERNDAGLPVRIAVLTDLMHSDVPAARIAAARELGEIDETAKAARIGNTWEDSVRRAKLKAAQKLKAAGAH